jgi:hypothetical protein
MNATPRFGLRAMANPAQLTAIPSTAGRPTFRTEAEIVRAATENLKNYSERPCTVAFSPLSVLPNAVPPAPARPPVTASTQTPPSARLRRRSQSSGRSCRGASGTRGGRRIFLIGPSEMFRRRFEFKAWCQRRPSGLRRMEPPLQVVQHGRILVELLNHEAVGRE